MHLVAILLGTPGGVRADHDAGDARPRGGGQGGGRDAPRPQSALGTEEGREVAPYFHAKWEEEQAVKYSGIEHVIFRPSFIFGRDGGILAQQIKVVRYSPVTPILSRHRMQPIWVDDVASLFTAAVSAERGAEPDVRRRRAGPPQLGRPPRADPQDARKAAPGVQMPPGLLKAGATVGQILPPFHGARAAVEMLDLGDNVGDIGPVDRGLRRPADRHQGADSPGGFLNRIFAPKLQA